MEEGRLGRRDADGFGFLISSLLGRHACNPSPHLPINQVSTHSSNCEVEQTIYASCQPARKTLSLFSLQALSLTPLLPAFFLQTPQRSSEHTHPNIIPSLRPPKSSHSPRPKAKANGPSTTPSPSLDERSCSFPKGPFPRTCPIK